VLNPQRLIQQAAQIFSLFRRAGFHVKKQRHYFATISLQAKIAGRFWKPTKNAPAIANVRAQEVRRKKKFLKKCRVGLLTVVVPQPV
jgi:hypothetical protein